MTIKKEIFSTVFAVGIVAGTFVCFVAHAQTVGVTVPSAPTSVSATISNSPSQVTVSWAASTESSGTIEGYYVSRNGSQITATAGTSIVDAGLQPGLYSYTIVAYDANNVLSTVSSPASVTIVADTTPPTPPSGVMITGTTSTNSFYTPVTLTISWDPSSDNVGVAGYYVYRNGVSIASSTSALTATSITDTVAPGVYTYTVVAYDAAQNFSNRSAPVTVTVAVDSNPPSAPTNVSVQQVSATGVNVSWASSTDSVGITGYQIFRNGIQIASTTGSPYADGGLSAGSAYSYRVAAYDVAGNISSQSSPAVNVTIQMVNGPEAPYALSAALAGTSSIALSWAPSSDSLPVVSYSIYRNGMQIATATSTNYLDEGLASGTYEYNLIATDVTGAVSEMSASSSFVTVPVFNPTAASAPTETSNSVPVSALIITPATTTSGSPAMSSAITQSLYYGLRNTQVTALQTILVQDGDLAPAYATGFFGNLTRAAVEKFQCGENIVCTGGAGWGLVGPKTRNALNALGGQGSVAASTSTTSLTVELQMLQAELAGLEKQAL